MDQSIGLVEFFLLLFKMGSYHVARTGLELLDSRDSLASVS